MKVFIGVDAFLSSARFPKHSTIEFMFINGMFPLSSRTKHWARVVIDSVWLINTFFVVFRGSEGRSTGLTISTRKVQL